MEAKDTRILRNEVTFCSKDMNEQAEISFREGKRKALDGVWDKVMGAKKSGFDEGRQEGIREVVEFLQGELTKIPNMPDPNAECNALNGLISQIIELYGISPHPTSERR